MKRSHLACVRLFLVLMLPVLGIAGCEDKPDAAAPSGSTPAAGGAGGTNEAKPAASVPASVLGTYENAVDKLTIVLKADNKVTMIDEGKSTELTWEMDGANKVIIHGQDGARLIFTINSEGHLSSDMGGVFRKK